MNFELTNALLRIVTGKVIKSEGRVFINAIAFISRWLCNQKDLYLSVQTELLKATYSGGNREFF